MASFRAVRLCAVHIIATLFAMLCMFGSYLDFMDPYVSHHPFGGFVVYILVFGPLVVAYVAMLRCIFVDAGRPPLWIRADAIDVFVRTELQRIAARSSAQRRVGKADARQTTPLALREGEYDRADGEADACVSANAQLHTILTQRMRDALVEDYVEVRVLGTAAGGVATASHPTQGEHDSDDDDDDGDNDGDERSTTANIATAASAASTTAAVAATAAAGSPAGYTAAPTRAAVSYSNSDSNTTATDNLPLDLSSKAEERRQRKQRHGLPTQTASQLARTLLEALDADTETREHKMALLLRGARVCRLCGVYTVLGTVHCGSCERCVLQRDHHNFMFGQCVGRHTHKYFVLISFYVTVTLATLSVCTVIVLCSGAALPHVTSIFDKVMYGLRVFMTYVYLDAVGSWTGYQVYIIGTADSTTESLRRKSREDDERCTRRLTLRGVYRFIVGVEDDLDATQPQPFAWRNLRRAFGEGPPGLQWLLPTSPQRPTPAAEERAFWDELREHIDMYLRCTADLPSDAEGSNDDMNNNDDDTTDATTTMTRASASDGADAAIRATPLCVRGDAPTRLATQQQQQQQQQQHGATQSTVLA